MHQSRRWLDPLDGCRELECLGASVCLVTFLHNAENQFCNSHPGRSNPGQSEPERRCNVVCRPSDLKTVSARQLIGDIRANVASVFNCIYIRIRTPSDTRGFAVIGVLVYPSMARS